MPAVAPPKNEVLADAIYRISVERYLQIFASGVLNEDDAVELLDGLIVNKMPRNRRHIAIANFVAQLIARLLATTHHIEVESAIQLATSMVEPDLVVARGSMFDYENHLTAADVALVVEVADSSLRRDQTWKQQLYADAGIAVYWIVNVPEQMVEVYSEPATERAGYRQLRTYAGTEEVPVMVDGEEIGRFAAQTLFPS